LSYIGKTPTPAPLTSSDITDGIISTSKLADTSVTNAKINADIISAETELATAPADTDEFLISDAGVLKRLDASLVGVSGWSSNSGNLLPADASKGIYLGVNSATASNLLDDYEEGSFTTTLNSGLGASLNDWNYTKIGNFVILSGKVTINSSDGGSTQVTMSLPFNSSGRNAVTVNFVSGQNTGTIGLSAYSNSSSTMQFYGVQDNADEFNHTNADVSSGDEYYMTFTYRSA